MSPPSISVAVLTYNRVELLDAMLKSLLGQTDRDFSITVYDNASTDGTREYLAKIASPRVIPVSHGHNLGAVGNANFAIRDCHTDYLILTHDDDLAEASLVETYRRMVESNPERDLICCDITTIDQAGTVLDQAVYSKRFGIKGLCLRNGDEFLQDFAQGRNYVACPTVLLKVGFLRQKALEFRAAIGPSSDSFLWCEMATLGARFAFVGEPLYRYRLHSTQDSLLQANVLATNLRKPIAALLEDNHRELVKTWRRTTKAPVLREWESAINAAESLPMRRFLRKLTTLADIPGFGFLERLAVGVRVTLELVREVLRGILNRQRRNTR